MLPQSTYFSITFSWAGVVVVVMVSDRWCLWSRIDTTTVVEVWHNKWQSGEEKQQTLWSFVDLQPYRLLPGCDFSMEIWFIESQYYATEKTGWKWLKRKKRVKITKKKEKRVKITKKRKKVKMTKKKKTGENDQKKEKRVKIIKKKIHATNSWVSAVQ